MFAYRHRPDCLLLLLLLLFSFTAVKTSGQTIKATPSLRPTKPPTKSPTKPSSQAPTSNVFTRPTSAPTHSAAVRNHLQQIKSRILVTIKEKPRIAATFVRLIFHDCVPNGVAGGCDGCINLDNPANRGLAPALDALAPIVQDFQSIQFNVTRADIWAFAALIAAENAQSGVLFTDAFRVGRRTCEKKRSCTKTPSSLCASAGPDVQSDFPPTDSTTHSVLNFFRAHFGYNANQTVAIFGAHTLGRALPENSGFIGKWAHNEFALNNGFYQRLSTANWIQIQLNATGRFQWVRGVANNPLMMLNADIALVRDLGSGFLNKSKASCVFKLDTSKSCPMAKTMTKVVQYSTDNAEWVSDFKEVLTIMVEKGLK